MKSLKDSIVGFMQSEENRRDCYTMFQPLFTSLYNEMYPYLLFICIYLTILTFIILINLVLLVRVVGHLGSFYISAPMIQWRGKWRNWFVLPIQMDSSSSSTKLILREQFTDHVKNYVVYDSQLKKIQEKTQEIRAKREQASRQIVQFLQTTGNAHKKISVHDSDLKIVEKKDYSPLTFSFLEEHLGKIIPDANQVQRVIEFLKQQRQIKVSTIIKRTYHKEEC